MLRSKLALLIYVALAASPFAAPKARAIQVPTDPQVFQMPKSQAMGSSTVASDLDNESAFQNPASGAFQKHYGAAVGYNGIGDTLGASIVDTKSGPIGGGVSYQRVNLSNLASLPASAGSAARREDRVGVILMGILGNNLGVGLRVKYIYRRSLDSSTANGSAYNGDVGLRYVVNPQLAVGVLAESVLEDDKALYSKHYTFGADVHPMPELDISFQFRQTPKPDSLAVAFPKSSTNGWGIGAEYTIRKGIFARLGYRSNDPWGDKDLGIGFGYKDESYALDYCATLWRGDTKTTTHSLSLTAFY